MSDSPESEIRAPIFDKFENGSEGPSNADISITPNTELSPPDSPATKNVLLSKAVDERTKSRTLAASLSLEEQVRPPFSHSGISIDNTEQISLLVAADFWRSKSLPEKGIPAFKTSDGPNGARGAIFKAGTKVCPIALTSQTLD
jgi:beta-glucosidase